MKVYRGTLSRLPSLNGVETIKDGRLVPVSWDDARVEVWEWEPAILDFDDVQIGTDRLKLVGPLTHHVKHSPSGFSWGYSGSGPSELARCLLIDHLADRAWCPECLGAGLLVWRFPREPCDGEPFDQQNGWRVRYDPGVDYAALTAAGDPHDVGSCDACWGEKTSFPPALYQRYKFDRIARLPNGPWEITAAEIDVWLTFDKLREAGNG